MDAIYGQDLAYIQAAGFGGLARGAAPEIVRLLGTASIRIRRVLEVGCGSGPLTAALMEAGFETVAIEPSAELLAFAQQAAPAARFVHGSVYDVEIPDSEAIVALGEPLTYHARDADAEGLVGVFFRRASAALPQGGLLIFDVIETGQPSLAGPSWSSGDDWAVLVETTEDLEASTLVRRIETFRKTGELYRRGQEVHTVRLFDTQTLRNQLTECGFVTETAHAYGSQGLNPRRCAFIATRL
jgi:SAM-dependent methyltransferase